MTIRQYLEGLYRRLQAAELSYGHGTDNPYDEACYLMLGSLGLEFDQFDDALDRELEDSEVELLEKRARRRIDAREPVAYLVGEAWFAGLRFRIDERALVPRSPMAELIGHRFEPLLSSPPRRVLDLCCGNGCIGIATALTFPETRVDLVDLSSDALDLARQNVEMHCVMDRVNVIESDLFENLDSLYDLIVCNPPYVGQEEYVTLPEEFTHEPRMGLLTGDSGLEIPLRILRRAADYLSDRGILIMEVGYSDHLLSARYGDVPFLWLDFEHGGQGVFLLTRSQLQAYRDHFKGG